MTDRHFIRLALLGYALVVLLVLTLSPFRFAMPPAWVVAWWSDWADIPVNFLLFLPLGYLFRLATARTGRGGERSALLFGIVVSLSIELSQLFLESRLTSLTDLISNSLGAAAGAALCNALRRRIGHSQRGVPTFDLPLTNLLYMLVPLMWLACTGIGADLARIWALAPLGMTGALVLIGLWRFRLHATLHLPRVAVLAMVAAWLGLGAMAGISVAPEIVLKAVAAVLLASLAVIYLIAPHPGMERRFEARVLRGVWPCFLVYVLFISLGSGLTVTWPFEFTPGYPQLGFDRGFSLRIAEQLTALTVLGYLIGESRGRDPLAPRESLVRTLLIAAACAVIVEVLHGFVPGQRASLFRGSLAIMAAAFGAVMYAAQLNVVRILRHAEDDVHAGRADRGGGPEKADQHPSLEVNVQP